MNPFYKNLALWLVIFLLMVLIFNLFQNRAPLDNEISYSDFLNRVEKGEVATVKIQGDDIHGTDTQGKSFRSVAPKDTDLIKRLRDKNVRIEVKPPEKTSWVVSILASWVPLVVLIGLWIFFMRQMQSGGSKAMSFGKSRARLLNENSNRITFEDVAGVDEAKEELAEIVEFLRDPHKFTRLGGRIPKGVLLIGPPGSGKTLLARAIAGEAGVPFFSISGSDFVEMFVGVGASRVRDLFMQGKKNAPCIIFIDEIDAVGRHRGAGLGGGHDEREQTLNQLLVEMDGFESNEGVILISATNRPDVLDPALMRPGRFDRQVVVPLPDVRGREAVFKVHMKRSPVAEDVDTLALAKGTAGFSGADIENLVNEAALLAAKRNKDKLEMADFEDAKDKVYMGLERKSKLMDEEDLKNTAYHEGGHALVARFLPDTDAVNKVTIIPRGRALGVTWFLPEERDSLYQDHLEHRLAISYGGRVAEELVFGRVSTGAAQDIKHATDLAQKMVREWGMSALGPVSYTQGDEQIFLGKEISRPRDYSQETAQRIDDEVHKLVEKAYATARKILTENRDILDSIADILLEKETIMGQELDELIVSKRPGWEPPTRRPARKFRDRAEERARKMDRDMRVDKARLKEDGPPEEPPELPEDTPPGGKGDAA